MNAKSHIEELKVQIDGLIAKQRTLHLLLLNFPDLEINTNYHSYPEEEVYCTAKANIIADKFHIYFTDSDPYGGEIGKVTVMPYCTFYETNVYTKPFAINIGKKVNGSYRPDKTYQSYLRHLGIPEQTIKNIKACLKEHL